MDADLIFIARFKGRHPPHPPRVGINPLVRLTLTYFFFFFFFCFDEAGYLVSMRGCGGPSSFLIQCLCSDPAICFYSTPSFCLAIVE